MMKKDLKTMSDILIKDNFLKEEDFKKIQKDMMSDFFPWYFNEDRTQYGDNKYQFTHTFFRDCQRHSDKFEILQPLFDRIGVNSLVRVKANLTLRTNNYEDMEKEHYHTDFDDIGCKTGIFYINTNNGKTMFENGYESESIENRFVSFPVNLKHTGSTNTDVKRRIVLNVNWY